MSNFYDKPKILHVEDDEDVRKITHAILCSEAHVFQASNLKDAKAFLKSNEFDLLLLDVELPDGKGTELLPIVNKYFNEKIVTVIFSAYNVNEDIARQVDAVLLKSNTSNDDLLRIVNMIKTKRGN